MVADEVAVGRTDETGMVLTLLPPIDEEAARRVERTVKLAGLTVESDDVGKIEGSEEATETVETANTVVLVPNPTGTDGV